MVAQIQLEKWNEEAKNAYFQKMQFTVSNAWKHNFKLVFGTKHNVLAKICSNGYVQSLFLVYCALFFFLGSLQGSSSLKAEWVAM